MTITEDEKKIIKAQRKIREDERREKFKLLAEARVTKIIKLIIENNMMLNTIIFKKII